MLHIFQKFCFGTNHTHELYNLHQLMNKNNGVKFTKLSPNNIPDSLQRKLKPDYEFVLPYGRKV